MSVQELSADTTPRSDLGLEWALARISERAGDLDREPRFPAENFADLAATGALDAPSEELAGEIALVRAVAQADASTARILDGHLNGIERLALHAERHQLAQIAQQGLLLGVWGADPAAGEGPPARLERTGSGLVLRGVKTFCSGAGGVQRALVISTDDEGAHRLAYLDTTSRVSVDRGWYRASGLRSSESHRVEFHDTPVLALLGGPGELSREPYLSRDAIRTSATWAGLVDRIVWETSAALDPQRADDLQAHALGAMRVAAATIDRWLEHTADSLVAPRQRLRQISAPALAVECRVALAQSARLICSLASQACGSRALIGGGALDRARRDLDLFLLQHRLDPKITNLGREALERQQQ